MASRKTPHLKRELTLIQLVFIGVAGTLGNGALFGAVGMVTTSGPGAVFAFLFGAAIYSTIAVTYMELSRVHPEAGGPSRFSLYSHGRTVSLINSFADIVWYLFIPPAEALSIVDGINYLLPHSPLLVSTGAHLGFPTPLGVAVGVALVLAFAPFNYFGIGMFGRSTKYIGAVKIFFYVSMSLGLIFVVHNFGNFTSLSYHGASGILPYGAVSILLIMPLTMYDFGGTRVIPDLAGETVKDEVEKKDAIVKAVGLTILFETLIYISVAVAIAVSVNWHALGIPVGDWSALKASTHGNNPFFVLAHTNHLFIVFLFAVVTGLMTPFVTGYIYSGAGARIFFSTSRSGFLGGAFKTLHKKYGVPFWAIITFAIVGAITVMVSAPSPTVYSILYDATVAGYLGFSTHPVAMMVQRKQGVTKDNHKIRGGAAIAPIAMGTASLVVYWSGWPSDPYAILLITIGVLVFGIPFKGFEQVRNAIWYIVYFVFLFMMVIFSKVIGPGTLFGASVGYIPFLWGTVITFAVTTLVFFPWGIRSGLKEEYYHEEYTEPYRAESSSEEEPGVGHGSK